MATSPEIAWPADPPATIVDVWSRTAPKYRRRAILMLSLLSILFGALCCFTFWLRTGAFWPWSYDGYGDLMRKSFTPTGPEQVTLTDFLTYPISVQDVPAHGFTMGVLFATLSSIPILVAILYRFPCSILFAVMVFFLAAMPWLGITVLLGCAITAFRPFRFTFRYASALLGLAPVAVYFVMASWEPAGYSSGIQHRALLYAPWFLALLGCCVICAIALGLARVINYRPGGMTPLLAVLFVIPVVVFFTKVGVDELDYHLLKDAIGPESPMFSPADLRTRADREATRVWSESRDQSYDEIRAATLRLAIDDAYEQLENDRIQAALSCDRFIDHFPKSRHISSVLYLKGRALDCRLRRPRRENNYRAEYVSDFPSPLSRTTWETLATQIHGQLEVVAPALLQLGILSIRDGDFDQAAAWLDRLRTSFGPYAEPVEKDEATTGNALPPSAFRTNPPGAGLAIDIPGIRMRGRRLDEMLKACAADPGKSLSSVFEWIPPAADRLVRPLQLLLSMDDGDPAYAANLAGLVIAFPQSETAGYASIRQAMLNPAISVRIVRFRSIAAAYDGRPAGAEALFRLAQTLDEDSILDESKATFDELVKKYPTSCWSDEARERLSSIAMLRSTSG